MLPKSQTNQPIKKNKKQNEKTKTYPILINGA